jgi:hypothetical protein
VLRGNKERKGKSMKGTQQLRAEKQWRRVENGGEGPIPCVINNCSPRELKGCNHSAEVN